jgi:hypothetical protein
MRLNLINLNLRDIYEKPYKKLNNYLFLVYLIYNEELNNIFFFILFK